MLARPITILSLFALIARVWTYLYDLDDLESLFREDYGNDDWWSLEMRDVESSDSLYYSNIIRREDDEKPQGVVEYPNGLRKRSDGKLHNFNRRHETLSGSGKLLRRHTDKAGGAPATGDRREVQNYGDVHGVMIGVSNPPRPVFDQGQRVDSVSPIRDPGHATYEQNVGKLNGPVFGVVDQTMEITSTIPGSQANQQRPGRTGTQGRSGHQAARLSESQVNHGSQEVVRPGVPTKPVSLPSEQQESLLKLPWDYFDQLSDSQSSVLYSKCQGRSPGCLQFLHRMFRPRKGSAREESPSESSGSISRLSSEWSELDHIPTKSSNIDGKSIHQLAEGPKAPAGRHDRNYELESHELGDHKPGYPTAIYNPKIINLIERSRRYTQPLLRKFTEQAILVWDKTHLTVDASPDPTSGFQEWKQVDGVYISKDKFTRVKEIVEEETDRRKTRMKITTFYGPRKKPLGRLRDKPEESDDIDTKKTFTDGAPTWPIRPVSTFCEIWFSDDFFRSKIFPHFASDENPEIIPL